MANEKRESSWYHGAQQPLTTLLAGSSITQDPDVARAFSHRPSLVSMQDDGTIKHDGLTPGYLHRVVESVGPDDVYPHPHPVNAAHWEWLTRRPLQVECVERTVARPRECLTDDEVADLRRRQTRAGARSFLSANGDVP